MPMLGPPRPRRAATADAALPLLVWVVSPPDRHHPAAAAAASLTASLQTIRTSPDPRLLTRHASRRAPLHQTHCRLTEIGQRLCLLIGSKATELTL